MICNLMYVISLKSNEDGVKYVPANGIIHLTLDVENPKRQLKITSVNGDIQIPGDSSSKRAAQIDDLLFSEQTLFDVEYWLDNGKFDAFPPLD